MKIVELITDNISVAVTNEEVDLIKKVKDNPLLKRDLSEREQLVANNLVNKNVLSRTKNEQGSVVYKKRFR